MKEVSTFEKAFICCLMGLLGALLSLGSAEFGGLWFVIVPVFLVTAIESYVSYAGVSEKSETAVWFGLMFHVAAAVFFFALCDISGHEIFQKFEYIIDHGHGNFDFTSDDPILWGVLIGILAFRVAIIEPILAIAYANAKAK